jgi:hypothetical protein
MKTLILGPIDYPSARQDLILMNYNENVYSTLYAFEGMYAATTREGKQLSGGTISLLLYLSEEFTDKEYDSSDIFFGFVPKTRKIDRVICYNFDSLSAQEALLLSYFPEVTSKFYTTADITHKVDNIMEAIKLAQSPTEDSD